MRTDVGSPAGGDDLDDLVTAAGAALTGAAVDLEAILEGSLDAVDVAEVVDRGAAGLDARQQGLAERGRQARPTGRG